MTRQGYQADVRGAYGDPTVSEWANRVLAELARARSIHAPMNTAHEGYAVLLEEVDELWDAIKGDGDIREEAVQVAAMAIRLLVDVCTPHTTERSER